jgi:hypothetical protein
MSILVILFWLLLILAIIGVFVPEQPFIVRGRWVVLLILLAILGIKVFGFPS